MIILVDAFNVIYKFNELEDFMHQRELEQAMRGLIEIIRRFQRSWKKTIHFHLFFDGKRKRSDDTRQLKIDSTLTLYYSHDLSADHLIMEFIKHSKRPADLRVVTSDKEVIDFARKHRCDRQSSEDFAGWVESHLAGIPAEEQDPGEAPQVSDNDINYWKKMFGIGS